VVSQAVRDSARLRISMRSYERPDLAQEFVSPETDTESTLAGIWKSALSITRIGIRDQFFELGGDSVLAGQVLARINRVFGTRIGYQSALEDFTVERLAQLIDDELMSKLNEMSDEEVEKLLRS
jgi:phthiocerol/phenolphthiocerol synthesis type-I polyketide synthase E